MPFIHCGKALIIMDMASFYFNTGAGNQGIVMDMTFDFFYISGKIMAVTIKVRVLA